MKIITLVILLLVPLISSAEDKIELASAGYCHSQIMNVSSETVETFITEEIELKEDRFLSGIFSEGKVKKFDLKDAPQGELAVSIYHTGIADGYQPFIAYSQGETSSVYVLGTGVYIICEFAIIKNS